jgi:hypothetical protein
MTTIDLNDLCGPATPTLGDIAGIAFVTLFSAVVLGLFIYLIRDIIRESRWDRTCREWTEEARQHLINAGVSLRPDDVINVKDCTFWVAFKSGGRSLLLDWVDAEDRWKLFINLPSGERLHVTADIIRRMRERANTAEDGFIAEVHEAAPKMGDSLWANASAS